MFYLKSNKIIVNIRENYHYLKQQHHYYETHSRMHHYHGNNLHHVKPKEQHSGQTNYFNPQRKGIEIL